MGEYKTPGVCIKEKNALVICIVEVGNRYSGLYRPY